ncbi:Ppx/GppA family phosphatase [Novosphingopyxis iocasae]|uniref:Ppx/GppA family phosphatase n=1 Tax=Novosphingopyxis iocasae TaxID=2762729 RepID=UPI001FE92347|nr:Ppx/GppA family phosphatase [Novosphingopyxis iocasae]
MILRRSKAAAPEAAATPSMRSAVVDIGSNSVRLVVHSGHPRAPSMIFNEKVMAGLGGDLAATGRIGEESSARALRALSRFRLLCDRFEVERVDVIATAAVRDAENGDQFLEGARAHGFEPRVLSGEEEAYFAGMGVLAAFPDAKGWVGDLGGGSLEIARIGKGQVKQGVSLPFGVLRAKPILDKGTGALAKRFGKALAESDLAIKDKPMPLYLVGGSWRSLARIDMEAGDWPLRVVHHYEIAPARAVKLADRVAAMDAAEIGKVPGVGSSRVPYMREASRLLALLVEQLKPSNILISAFGVREGTHFDALDAQMRSADPLLAGTADMGRAEGRFPLHGIAVDEWIAPLFESDSAEWQRLRRAACNLGDVAWRANPDFRAERGLEAGLHGNWVGIDGAGREMLGQALYTSFGGGTSAFPGGGALAGAKAIERAIAWGLAMRLAQRISAGMAAPLKESGIRVEGERLILSADAEALLSETVEKRLGQLASYMGLRAEVA